MRRIYLDYAATTPVDPEVVKTMSPFFTETFGNPSGTYSYGQEAKEVIEEARVKVSELIGAKADEIVFTSGGTESDNFALVGVAYANQARGNHIITTPVEHHAVTETCNYLEERGFRITYVPVDEHGLVDPSDVKKAIMDDTILISVMHANNEMGTIEPIVEIGKIAKEREIYFHADAVQTVGHLPVDVDELGVDLLSLSAHKFYGPKGIGVLYIRRGIEIAPFMHGGEQERRLRAGTENVPGIVGLGRAIEMAGQEMGDETDRLTSLRDKLITGILEEIDHTRLNGHPSMRLPNNVNISFGSLEGESIVLNLDLEGICASTGSACSSASLEPSHVLSAMGLSPEQVYGSVRFSLGKWTSEEMIERVLEVLPKIVQKLRAVSPLMQGNRH
ncbi:MAG: cysteine desulfurase NifS [Deltaproteobacteria bacterium]|nr:MAG: cysteine desulfurase NifS [Deltaproteobacteria bacterium]